MVLSLLRIRDTGGGSIVHGTVDVANVATATGVPLDQVVDQVAEAQDTGMARVFAKTTGRIDANSTGRPDSSLLGALVAAYGPGPRGGRVNVAAAAAGEGKSTSTIKRWMKGAAEPLPENRAQLLANARKAATTAQGRRAALSSRRAGSEGSKMSRYGAFLTVHALQGVEEYERQRSVTWELDPDQVEEALQAWEEDGEAGLANWMREYANTEKYGNTENWNVFNFGDPQSGESVVWKAK
ncbi:hypothetical protein [Nocardia altamirensis]|uniref:hypothetical protein n=1 Tax=Nocardia altamirensis TaxID=472158 RepID=UPI00084004F2|nr:hypothetical protein [Nocardia altamirensis]